MFTSGDLVEVTRAVAEESVWHPEPPVARPAGFTGASA